MKISARKIGLLVVAAALLAGAGLVSGGGVTQAAGPSGQVIYDSTVSPLPGNLPSVGAEAYAFNELGDAVTFAGTARNLSAVTVTMSSWACQSGNWHSGNCATTPGATSNVAITLNVYNPGDPTPGSLIATKTQTFAIPYRPSADNVNCTLADAGKWYQASTGTCFNGLATNITFDFSSMNVVLPNGAVYGIVYNTTSYGPSPIGTSASCFSTSSTAAGCFYDSLNIALSSAVTVGSKTFPNTIYQNSPYGSEYCDGGLAGTGTFRLDSPSSPCWAGYIPAVQITAFQPATTKDQCKSDGWKVLARADGTSFKNQGDCVSFTNNGK